VAAPVELVGVDETGGRSARRTLATTASTSPGLVAAAAASATVGDPRGYGQAVAAELLPDLLPYVIGTPATYGFAVRNGRPLADNAPEVMLSLVTGTAIPSGLKPAATGHLRTAVFPYVLPAQRAR